MSSFAIAAYALIGLKLAAEWSLERINEQHARRRTAETETDQRALAYTAAKSRLARREALFEAATLAALLASGLFPALREAMRWGAGPSLAADSLFLFASWCVFAALGLPWAWHRQFHLEAAFGFNKTTPATWWRDLALSLALAALLGCPIIALLLWLFQAAGSAWWLWGWAAVMAFQFVMAAAAPALILPLFNRFEDLGAGPLKRRLESLCEKAGFQASAIQVMDGSRRSTHSNAFFTGIGAGRKIVLFDTLTEQLTEEELEAVLAHEIGHFQRRHVPKTILWSAALLLAGFFAMDWILRSPEFASAFGFAADDAAAAFLLFGLLSGPAAFWISPLAGARSRRFEYEADRYASDLVGGPAALISALIKLRDRNLANRHPHPWYSAFYYSHPTLEERERALGA